MFSYDLILQKADVIYQIRKCNDCYISNIFEHSFDLLFVAIKNTAIVMEFFIVESVV